MILLAEGVSFIALQSNLLLTATADIRQPKRIHNRQLQATAEIPSRRTDGLDYRTHRLERTSARPHRTR